MPLRTSAPVVEQHLHRFFHEERVALGLLDDEPLERTQFHAVAEQRRQHLVGAFLAQRVEPQLRVVGLVAPLMAVLGPIVHQQQDARGADAVGEQVQECLRLAIDPVQVLEDHDQRLVEALAQQDALDRLERASLAGLRLDLRELIVLIGQSRAAPYR